MVLWLSLLLVTTSFEHESAIKDALTVGASSLAVELSKEALKNTPDNPSLLSLYITSLAESEKIDEMLKEWEELCKLSTEKANEPFLLESMAWGVIRKGARDTALPLRMLSLVAAAMSRDFRGVRLVEQAMDHPNAIIRTIAYKVSGQMGDACLQNKLRIRLKEEKETEARMAMIRAVGELQMKELEPFLVSIVEGTTNRQLEREAAFEALLHLHERPQLAEVEELLKSPRSLHRAVGSRLALHLSPPPPLSLFAPLLEDSSRRVVLEAARTVGLLFAKEQDVPELIKGLKKRPEGEARVASLWIETLRDGTLAEDWLPFINHPNNKVALYSAALLGTAGEKSLPLRETLFDKVKDPFVKMTLALDLLPEVADKEPILTFLSKQFDLKNPLWGISEQGGIAYLSPQKGENLPPMVSQKDLDIVARIQFLSVIAPFAPKFAEEKLKNFLTHRRPEVGLLATTLLIKEGSNEILEQVEELLEDPKFPHRVEAALLLSLWRRDEEGVKLLKEHYPNGDRREKETLLEAIGRLGSPADVPFFIDCLKEPFPMLRVIAAIGLISCLNN